MGLVETYVEFVGGTPDVKYLLDGYLGKNLKKRGRGGDE